LFDPENIGNTFLRNIRELLPEHTATFPEDGVHNNSAKKEMKWKNKRMKDKNNG
jgi:hypothetical protein